MALRFQSKTCAKLDAERVDDVYRFDGIGGELAHADKNFIELDAEERWSIDLVEGKFCLYPVLLHELGHVLGLGHGPHGATMDPYYPGSQLLTEWDVEAVQGLYGTPPPPGDPAKDLDRPCSLCSSLQRWLLNRAFSSVQLSSVMILGKKLIKRLRFAKKASCGVVQREISDFDTLSQRSKFLGVRSPCLDVFQAAV